MRVLKVDAEHPDARLIAEAARELRAGRVVVFPTETVYGLGAIALDRGAVKRVFEVKGRPATHPLIVHVLGEDDARRYAAEWPALAGELARAFWPGPLTLVVEKADLVPPEVTGGSPGVAVRAPSHPVARALLAALGPGEAIVAPSARRPARTRATTRRGRRSCSRPIAPPRSRAPRPPKSAASASRSSSSARSRGRPRRKRASSPRPPRPPAQRSTRSSTTWIARTGR